ncbi:major facilitator superfamily domain-containing protein [Hypoxylon sp. NC0597]|nr:major facilitator superfamily domain-containing protein [Hypoxylon sp. NC0597]
MRTRNWALHTKLEEHDTDVKSFVGAYLLRPWILLITERIFLVVTIYMAFVYSLLFLFFEGFPIAFVEVRGWEPRIGSLLFLWYRSAQGVIAPEHRLPPMIVGAVVLPPGMFWAALTSQPSTPWPAQVAAYIPVGVGLFLVFGQGFKYFVDVYLNVANSAISGNTFARSFFGVTFPLFAPALYHNLGMVWATTLLAFISLALAPVPVVFYIYGKKIRSFSKNALASV